MSKTVRITRCPMTEDEKLDEFLKLIGVELLSFQREILKQTMDQKIYICYPPHHGRTDFRILHYVMSALLKGENDV